MLPAGFTGFDPTGDYFLDKPLPKLLGNNFRDQRNKKNKRKSQTWVWYNKKIYKKTETIFS